MSKCVICGSELNLVKDYTLLKSVTSDCKPYNNISEMGVCSNCGHVQKFVTPKYMEEVNEIYRNYEVFKLSSGVEQIIFSGSQQSSRSTMIADWIKQNLSLSSQSSILDYGCGDGSALCSFTEVFPETKLYGYDIFEIDRPKTQSLANFKEMIVGPELETHLKFDLITFIHCLEHVEKPKEVLKSIHQRLSVGGHVFIEVPNLFVADYDILVADHVSHFDPAIIRKLLETCGFEIVDLTVELVTKEISVLARKVNNFQNLDFRDYKRVELNRKRVEFMIKKNLTTVAVAKDMLNIYSNVGIFGSSNSAMWLWGELQKATRLFVDEDVNKHQKNSNFEIIGPEDVPNNFIIMVPLVDDIAALVVKKYANRKCQFVQV